MSVVYSYIFPSAIWLSNILSFFSLYRNSLKNMVHRSINCVHCSDAEVVECRACLPWALDACPVMFH